MKDDNAKYFIVWMNYAKIIMRDILFQSKKEGENSRDFPKEKEFIPLLVLSVNKNLNIRRKEI